MKDIKSIGQELFLLMCILCPFFLTSCDSISPGEQFCTTNDGELGFCINLKNQIKYCPKLYSWLKSEEPEEWDKLRHTLCAKGISKEELRVCCPLSSYEETPSSLQTEGENDDDESFAEHPNFKLLPQDLKCGYIRLSGRIIGGANAKPGDFPFMARIGITEKGDSDDEPFFHCSGTIINDKYILTAAHCLTPITSGTHNLSVVRLAETDESVNPESITVDGYVYAVSPYLDFEVENFVIHPDYIASTGSFHDIALIRLKDKINTTSDFTVPVCLPFVKEYYLEDTLDDETILRQNATVCGFGKTANAVDVGSSILQYVTVPINSNIMCRIVYQSAHSVSHTQICAGGIKGKNSCAGDSGGPLLRNPNLRAKSSRHFQLGIVSYGKKVCADANEPAVYTRVRSYLKWILDNIKP